MPSIGRAGGRWSPLRFHYPGKISEPDPKTLEKKKRKLFQRLWNLSLQTGKTMAELKREGR